MVRLRDTVMILAAATTIACSTPAPERSARVPVPRATASATSSSVHTASTASTATATTIVVADAREIAFAKAKGRIESEELETESGLLVWSFDIRTADGTITEVHVDATNGKVVTVEYEDAAKERAEKASLAGSTP